MRELRPRVERDLPQADWDLGFARGGSCELGRICLKELPDTRQAIQLVALHILSVHAVKQEGVIQVLDKRSLHSET